MQPVNAASANQEGPLSLNPCEVGGARAGGRGAERAGLVGVEVEGGVGYIDL